MLPLLDSSHPEPSMSSTTLRSSRVSSKRSCRHSPGQPTSTRSLSAASRRSARFSPDALRPAKLLTPLPLYKHHDNLRRPPWADLQDFRRWTESPPDSLRIDLLLTATILLCRGESDSELFEVVCMDPSTATGPVDLGNHVALANAALPVAATIRPHAPPHLFVACPNGGRRGLEPQGQSMSDSMLVLQGNVVTNKLPHVFGDLGHLVTTALARMDTVDPFCAAPTDYASPRTT
jgi:hypothetical protein